MEILIDDSNNNAFMINNTLRGDINKYKIFFNVVKAKEMPKFIISIYQTEILIFRSEYSILGSYDKTKNVWIWADQSLTLDKSLVQYVKDLRCDFRNDTTLLQLKHFIDHDYYVLPTAKLINYIFHIGNKLFIENKYQLVTFLRNDDIIDFYIFKRILFERLF